MWIPTRTETVFQQGNRRGKCKGRDTKRLFVLHLHHSELQTFLPECVLNIGHFLYCRSYTLAPYCDHLATSLLGLCLSPPFPLPPSSSLLPFPVPSLSLSGVSGFALNSLHRQEWLLEILPLQSQWHTRWAPEKQHQIINFLSLLTYVGHEGSKEVPTPFMTMRLKMDIPVDISGPLAFFLLALLALCPHPDPTLRCGPSPKAKAKVSGALFSSPRWEGWEWDL